MRFTFLYPPDSTCDRVHHYHQLILDTLTELPQGHSVQVIGRISEKRFRQTTGSKLPYIDLFDHPAFKGYTGTIAEAEAKIGTTLTHIKYACLRRWLWPLSKSDDHIIPYVQAFQDILKDTDILIPTLDALVFTYVGTGIAHNLGIPSIKFIKGRIVNDSMMFWDGLNHVIYHNPPTDNPVLEAFKSRKKHINPDKAAPNRRSLIQAITTIPSKISILLDSPLQDMDTPWIIDKYLALLQMAISFHINPPLHRIFYSPPNFSDRYFLFPLHYEWEANMSVRETYTNQLELVYAISNSLPNNTKLYIKAHPHYKNADQDLLSMWFLSSIPNIRIIGPDESTTTLVKGSIGVITINGTVGYEAILHHKRLLTFGHEDYRTVAMFIPDIQKLPYALLACAENPDNTLQYDAYLKAYTSQIVPSLDPAKLAKELLHTIEAMR